MSVWKHCFAVAERRRRDLAAASPSRWRILAWVVFAMVSAFAGMLAALSAAASVLPANGVPDDLTMPFYGAALVLLAIGSSITERALVLLEDTVERRDERERKQWCWQGGEQHRWLRAVGVALDEPSRHCLLSIPSIRRARRTVAGYWAALGLAVVVAVTAFQWNAVSSHDWGGAAGVLRIILVGSVLLVSAGLLASRVVGIASGGRSSARERLQHERGVVERGEVISPVIGIGGVALAIVATLRMPVVVDDPLWLVVSAALLGLQIAGVLTALASNPWVARIDRHARRGRPAMLWSRTTSALHRIGRVSTASRSSSPWSCRVSPSARSGRWMRTRTQP